MTYRLGVDVGGTFTDVLLINEATSEFHTAKVPSTPADSSLGVLHGIELKSDLDTLERLRDQARAARPRFRRLVLVVGERHYASAVEALPRWWGVWLARETDTGPELITDISPAREAKENPRFNRLAQSKLLWKAELKTLLAREGIDLDGPPETRSGLAKVAASELTVGTVEAEIVRALQARRDRAARKSKLQASV